MDGSDGLVAGCMFVFFYDKYKVRFKHVNYYSSRLFSNFIYWNWSPAKIFMGDVGSTFLGVYFVANLLQFKNINEIIGFY